MTDLELDIKEGEFLKRKQVLERLKELYYLVLAGADIEIARLQCFDRGGDIESYLADLQIVSNDHIKKHAKLIEEQGVVDI